MTIDKSGSAFPQANPYQDGNGNWHYPDTGMSLRQWYAGQALAGLCSNSEAWTLTNEKLSALADSIADAMIARG